MLQPFQHTVLFSRRAITTLLRSAGFDVLYLDRAIKLLNLDYLAGQLSIHNALISRGYPVLRMLVPDVLGSRPFAVNIGEMMVFARSTL